MSDEIYFWIQGNLINTVVCCAFSFVVGFVFLCIARYLPDGRTDREIEAELDRDKEESDRIRVEAERITDGINKGKELSERIGEYQQRTTDSVGKVEKSISRAREKGRKTVELADECLRILEEAEKSQQDN